MKPVAIWVPQDVKELIENLLDMDQNKRKTTKEILEWIELRN